MSNPISITTALTLPRIEIDALVQGQTIVAISKAFTTPGRTFALYPSKLPSSLSCEQFYRSAFLVNLQDNKEIQNSDQTLIEAWATCEFCQILDQENSLDSLSKLTIWTTEALQEILAQQHRIFLLYLRVYKLSKPVETSIRSRSQFAPLTTSLVVDMTSPVISEINFTQRKNQLINLEPPLYPELEDLQSVVAQAAITDADANKLDQDLRAFLGWANTQNQKDTDPDLVWINQISEIGNSSDGNEFERLVRRSLIKLGFRNSKPTPKASLDSESTGGAGGIDVCCREPYPLIGECKASKNQSVPTDVCSQLTYLGQTHFSEEYNNAVKIIFAAGSLTTPANQVAIGNKMNVLRPETLQRLVELKAHYEGSIDLFTLESCLKDAPFGEEADTKLNLYIDGVIQDIRTRSKLVEIVKKLSQTSKKKVSASDICSAYNNHVFGLDNLSAWFDNQTVYELLIELSSPLAGRLGRVQSGGINSDRFYFLRDLPIHDLTD